MRKRRFLRLLRHPNHTGELPWTTQDGDPRGRDPFDGFVLRLTALGSSWTDGVYEQEGQARDRAREMARRHSEITDAYVWEYRDDRASRCRHIRLGRG